MSAPVSGLDFLLWGVLPYVTIVILIAGTVWRYRYDKFGWTTRSSALYESRLLRIGSPLFHFGLLVVIVGYVIGLLIPKSLTDAVGLSQEAYHLQALLLGAIAGFCTLAGVGS
jgi:nitrate reductase gamma subunit